MIDLYPDALTAQTLVVPGQRAGMTEYTDDVAFVVLLVSAMTTAQWRLWSWSPEALDGWRADTKYNALPAGLSELLKPLYSAFRLFSDNTC
jgi:hypothetical protein